MRIIFYNLLSITIGLVLIYFGIKSMFKYEKKLFPVLVLVHSVLFIGFGISGFFVPEMYCFIVILAMLAFTLTLILCFFVWGKKEPEEKKKDNKKKEPKEVKEDKENKA